jgi:hypothetical protein
MNYVFTFKWQGVKASGSGHTIVESKKGLDDETFTNTRKDLALKIGLEVGEIVQVTIQSIVNF